MKSLLSKEQLEQFWADVVDRGPNPPTRTVDRWGDVFTIFDGWGQVSDLHQFAVENLPGDILAQVANLKNDHAIEWAIGEFGFTDQFGTCSHCYAAIDTCDPMPYYYSGELLCGDCVKSNRDFADDYLSHAARHLEDGEVSGIIKDFANPDDHGFVCVNFYSACTVASDGPGLNDDHPAYDSRLTYAGGDDLQMLGKAARLVDPNLQLIYGHDGGSNVIWARFDPNANLEYVTVEDGGNFSFDTIDPAGVALGYALGLVFVKFGKLYAKKIGGAL